MIATCPPRKGQSPLFAHILSVGTSKSEGRRDWVLFLFTYRSQNWHYFFHFKLFLDFLGGKFLPIIKKKITIKTLHCFLAGPSTFKEVLLLLSVLVVLLAPRGTGWWKQRNCILSSISTVCTLLRIDIDHYSFLQQTSCVPQSCFNHRSFLHFSSPTHLISFFSLQCAPCQGDKTILSIRSLKSHPTFALCQQQNSTQVSYLHNSAIPCFARNTDQVWLTFL